MFELHARKAQRGRHVPHGWCAVADSSTRGVPSIITGSMRVVVTGGTGFLGKAIVRRLLERGEQVTVLTRPGGEARVPAGATAALWSPRERGRWERTLDGSDALLHLAGEPVLGGRWTDAQKARIEESRVLPTRLLTQAMATATAGPRVLVCASAIGYYGMHDGDQVLDEQSPPGDDFLARVCVAWEAAAREAESHGARVVRVRIGIVLGPGGGALEKMILPFRFYLGGPIGTGNQVLSWIHIDDLASLFLLALDSPQASGAINGTAPAPVTMNELSRAIGSVLRSPSWLRAPAFAVRLALGEAAEPLLGGQRVLPRAAEQLGFSFRYPEVTQALRQVLQDRN